MSEIEPSNRRNQNKQSGIKNGRMTTASRAAAALREDKWAWVKIGDPFPENPVRAKGEQNQYVALWYKNGKPVFGRAWNNGGVVECSFPYNKVELKGKDQLGGQIQVLVHQGDYDTNGYWYDWIKLPQHRQDHLKLVYCGEAAPILQKKGEGGILGNVFLKTETASISENGKAVELGPRDVAEVLVPVRNFKCPMGCKPGGGCPWCPPPLPAQAPPPPKEEGLGQLIVELGGQFGQDLFQDVRVGDPWPTHTVSAYTTSYEKGRPLKVGPGEEQESCVALWYQHGIPVMGRCWKDANGKIAASFGWNGHEYTNCGSFQILRHHNAKSHGFEYKWMTYAELKEELRKQSGWDKVHVSNIAPCINKTADGFERLGKVDMFNEVASYGWNGTEHVTSGPSIAPFIVLCRRDVPIQ
jgi:hypothetical protein